MSDRKPPDDSASEANKRAAFLSSILPFQRDEKTGRYLKGKVGGPGRLPGSHGAYSFRAVFKERIEAAGGDVPQVLSDLIDDLCAASFAGDVRATQILIDRLCGKEAEQLDVALSTSKLSDVERGARVAAILHAAAKRKNGPA